MTQITDQEYSDMTETAKLVQDIHDVDAVLILTLKKTPNGPYLDAAGCGFKTVQGMITTLATAHERMIQAQ